MAEKALITRRAAFTGALVAAAAATLPISAAVPAATIEALAEKFRDDAMALDPSIIKCWVGYDEVRGGPRENRVMSIYIERATKPFVRTRLDNDDIISQWWDQFSQLSDDGKRRYAEILRSTDARFNELADQIDRQYS